MEPNAIPNEWLDAYKADRCMKMPSYKGRERRRFPRFNKKLRVKYEFNEQYNITSSINISRGGFLIRSKSPVPVHSCIVAGIELPTSREDIIITSRVVRLERIKKKDIYLIAVNFISMAARDNIRLAEFIRSFKDPS